MAQSGDTTTLERARTQRAGKRTGEAGRGGLKAPRSGGAGDLRDPSLDRGDVSEDVHLRGYRPVAAAP